MFKKRVVKAVALKDEELGGPTTGNIFELEEEDQEGRRGAKKI